MKSGQHFRTTPCTAVARYCIHVSSSEQLRRLLRRKVTSKAPAMLNAEGTVVRMLVRSNVHERSALLARFSPCKQILVEIKSTSTVQVPTMP
jgi:hypothetical protein